MKRNRSALIRMTASALLAALIFLFGMTPMGLIPLGFVNITVLCIPVIIGAMVLGTRAGLLLGFCFGTASTLSMIGLSLTPPSGLASALFAVAPVEAVIMCYVPRLLVPLTAVGVYRLMIGICRAKRSLAVAVAAALGSLINTVCYLGLMLLFYATNGLDTKSILHLIAGTGLLAGGCEAAAAALISVPVVHALEKTPIGLALRRNGGK